MQENNECVRKSLQSDLNTYGVKSNKSNDGQGSNNSSTRDANVFVGGTFNGDPQPISVEQVDSVYNSMNNRESGNNEFGEGMRPNSIISFGGGSSNQLEVNDNA